MSGLLAYIGPGGGIVITGMLFTVLAALLGAVLIVVLYPALSLWRLLVWRPGRGRYRRVVILGIDGMDPGVTGELMRQGRLPAFSRLAATGCSERLRVLAPALSPAAWSTFATGRDASYHGIYDFIMRQGGSYQPALSSYELVPRPARFGLGAPGRPSPRLLRKSVSFWRALSRRGIESTVLRVPITFPPERIVGQMLAGMCVPDAFGTQGIYTLLAERDERPCASDSGVFLPLIFHGDRAETVLQSPIADGGGEATRGLRVGVTRLPDERVRIELAGHRVVLAPGRCSAWLRIPLPGRKRGVGIARFYLSSARPQVSLYMTPVAIDPERPAMALSHPGIFSSYLTKRIGVFGTLGLMEDTNAFNDGAIDAQGFLALAETYLQERAAMWREMVRRDQSRLAVCVFDTLDRVQHMFWRQRGERDVVADYYERFDALLGETMRHIDDRTLLLVISDHGFTDFTWSIDLNAWLHEQGYLHYITDQAGGAWMAGVDWSRTQAYALGLSGIYLNLAEREPAGIVRPGASADALAGEIAERLTSLTHEIDGQTQQPIRRVVVSARDLQGPYKRQGPDLLVGYAQGYRCSWTSARGMRGEEIISPNRRQWSGDHCVDPELVPGVLFANTRLTCPTEGPAMTDVAPTVCEALGAGGKDDWPGRSLLNPCEEEVRKSS